MRLIQHRNFRWVALAVVLGLGSVFNAEKIGSAQAALYDNHSKTVVPEPSTISLFCASAVFLLFLRAGKKNDSDSK